MARPSHALPLFPGAARDPLDAPEDPLPDYSSDEEDAEDEEEEDWDDADSGYDSLSEEDVSEEEDEDSEEDDQRLPPEDFWAGLPPWDPPAPAVGVPQQRAVSPPPASCPVFEEERRPGRSRRHRDEDEEEEPISKRPRFSCSEDIEEEPTPSTSAGTSGGFVHYFQQLHLLQDSDSDED
uniref:Uncharacterized protein n=1 Tax=Knipowitschia caucasica TaxID=637954 RepID=A0AAV2JVK7_KNICA